MSRAPASLDCFTAAAISLLFAAPLAAYEFFLVRTRDAAELVAALIVVAPAALILASAALATETAMRRRYLTGFQRYPWLSLTTAFALTVCTAIHYFTPAVLRFVPSLHEVAQTVGWSSRQGGTFSLFLAGRGAFDRPSFSSGDLVWSGPPPVNPVTGQEMSVGLRDIRFHPLTFRPANAADATIVAESAVDVRPHLQASGLSEAELDEFADSIWEVLQQANDGRPLASAAANVAAPYEMRGSLPSTVAGLAGTVYVLLQYLAVGQWTLVARSRDAPTDQPHEEPHEETKASTLNGESSVD